MSKSAKQFPLKASWAQLGRSWAYFLSSWLQILPSRIQIQDIFIDFCCPWNPQNRALAYTRARFSSFCHVAFQNIPEASKMRPKDLPRAVWEALGRALGLSWALLGCSWGTLGLFLGSRTRQQKSKRLQKSLEKYQKVLNNCL